MDIAGFDWDEGNCRKCQKHGVSIQQIEGLFRSQPWVAPDPLHSQQEERFLALGRTAKERPLFVVFTLRHRQGQVFIRPISARFMHPREVVRYEQAFTQNDH